MPDFTVTVDPDVRVAVVTWNAAQPTIELTRAALDALRARADFEPSFGVVSDWRLARASPEPVFVQQFLATLEAERGAGAFTGRWATVVPAGTALYGMARMTESLSDESRVGYRVFEDPAKAIEWARPA